MKQYPAANRHLLKLIYNQLPTRSKKAQWDPSVPSTCHYCSHEQTFDHLMRCSHDLAQQFRQTTIAAIREYGTKHKLPKECIVVFTQALQQWLCSEPVLRSSVTPEKLHSCIAAQDKIGWNATFRGYVSTKWGRFLQFEMDRKSNKEATSSTGRKHFTKIILILWNNMSKLWLEHLNNIHRQESTTGSHDKLQELKAKVRALHQLKHDTLAAHRDQYFHPDVEYYIQHASHSQLKTYLANYTPAIQSSIKAAKQISGPSLLSFAGFEKIRPLVQLPRTLRPI